MGRGGGGAEGGAIDGAGGTDTESSEGEGGSRGFLTVPPLYIPP